jgi:NAD(P)-dependent dehydrogenase (short-subunit alcohol dehydrogenase family)
MRNPSQTVLITGATSGIGRFTALYLARKGYRVFATGRRLDALESLQQEADGLDLVALRLDVTDTASIERARLTIDELTAGHGIDVLVNNAGYGLVAPMLDVTAADVRAQFETNVFGLLAVTQAFLPGMRRRGRGRIVNVTSVGGRLTLPLFGAYNATKYAVESMSDALRRELGPLGIDVALIEPGVINTDFGNRALHTLSPYRQADSPYAAVLEQAGALYQRADRMGVGPEPVARAIGRAIRARRPAARYVAPFRARIMLALYALTPTRVSDWVLRRLYGLTRQKLRALPEPSASLAQARPA